MPLHSMKTLEHRVTEFVEIRGGAEEVRVVVQEAHNGQGTCVVVVPLEHAPNSVWIEPRAAGDNLSWHVVIEQSEGTLDLTGFELNALTHDLQIAAELCAFSQGGSSAISTPSPRPNRKPGALRSTSETPEHIPRNKK